MTASSKSQQYFKSVGRHFVTLSFNQYLPGKPIDKPRVCIVSGFVVEITGIWFYMTAGHVLGEIKTAMERGVTFDAWRLDDQTAGAGFKHPIPYDFNINRWFVMRDDKLGLDYAVVPLEGLVCDNLRAGGVIPIDKQAWQPVPIEDCDELFLVGVPHETVSSPQYGIITGKINLIPLKLTPPPPMAGRTTENMFFAELVLDGVDPNMQVRDIGGMSGGPIFGTKKKLGDQTKYWAVGVQSSWYPDSKIIAACPVSSFMEALEDEINQFKKSLPK